jgi:hypothetical protein
MREELKELHELKRLLTTTRLTVLDRRAIEARIEELLPSNQEPASRKAEPPSLYLLGTFDRPTPAQQSQSSPQPTPEPQPSARDVPSKAAAQPHASEEQTEIAEPVLAPEEIERRSQLLADITDRITLLRAVWATTLSFDVAREIEAWLRKLQETATTVPKEAAERALGRHVGLLTTPVQTISKPQISEKIQELLLPPSAPSLDHADILSQVYWRRFARQQPREPEHPAGYIPDGLQSLVS